MIELRPSWLRDYLECPLRFRLRHRDRLGPKGLPASPGLSLGNSLHAALAALHRVAQPAAMPAEALLRHHWQRVGYTSAQEEARYFALALHALRRYQAEIVPPLGQVLGTEVYLARVVVSSGRRLGLAGRVDRITRLPDGTLEVLDYKAKANGQLPAPTVLARDLPTFLYYLLARVTYPAQPRVVIAQLNLFTLDKVTVDYDPAELATNKADLLSLADELERHAFAERLGAHCAYCPVRSQCPAYASEAQLSAL